MSLTVEPLQAWSPLPESAWDRAAAQHLLRRAGWSATPAEVERALKAGLAATLDRLFPVAPSLFPEPPAVARTTAEQASFQARLADAEPEQKRLIQREVREHSQAAVLDMTIKWLQFSARPENAAFQKWVLFLSDIYVVGFEKVPRAPMIYRHFDILARHALGSAPALTKAVSRSPAMVVYLDLNQSRKQAPNENFARELFELFVLGEGNYTEPDIKEAAKAFTGYRLRGGGVGGDFTFVPRQHDDGPKTVFGQTGNFTGDQVIDLAYGQAAAGAFVPHELAKFYLSDTGLPREYLMALGDQWRGEGQYSLRWLAHRFFGSQIFYAPEFRANFIKSPIQFYLGLIQDLELDVIPVPRLVANPMRQMGQVLFYPPNVRGWVGGRNWINSASLAARRNLAETLFAPLNERTMNQDELIDLVAAHTSGQDSFIVEDDRFGPLHDLPAERASRHLIGSLLPVIPPPAFQSALQDFIADSQAGNPHEKNRRLRRATVAVLQSPEYQLC
jgi:uncharacterized protein (DUF1800 family)